MVFRRARSPQAEDATDALLEGDQPLQPGTARAALRHRDFRIVWSGTFASNVGTWMQNVLLGAFAYELTGSSEFVGLLVFAQLGPLLFLGTVGGVLADALDRRKLLIWMQVEQAVFSVLLAVLALSDQPSQVQLFLCVLAIGIGNAIAAPSLGAIVPTLVPREDLPGAVSLQSVQMNLSRVIGPAIGAPLYAAIGAAPVFALNATTYVFAIAALAAARYDARTVHRMAETGLARLLSGFRIAAADPLIRRILVTLTVFSFFCLTFVGLMPTLAAESFGIRPKSVEYGLLYAVFGLGAAVGAVSVGTLFALSPKARLARRGLVAFAVLLAVFALLRSPPPAYPVAFVLGFAYFLVITSLATVLQEHLEDHVRGRIMALWIMAFGGVVPLGVLAGGYLAAATSITAIVVAGAGVALLLAAYADLRAVGAPG